jgi:hypothetical protein
LESEGRTSRLLVALALASTLAIACRAHPARESVATPPSPDASTEDAAAVPDAAPSSASSTTPPPLESRETRRAAYIALPPTVATGLGNPNGLSVDDASEYVSFSLGSGAGGVAKVPK